MGKISHIAPAGEVYESIEDAGKYMLKQNCPLFYESRGSSILPPIFINTFTDVKDQAGRMVPGADVDKDKTKEGKFRGAMNKQRGEDNEILVFKRFEQILNSEDTDFSGDNCHLILKGFSLEKYKLDAISLMLPCLQKQIIEFSSAKKKHNMIEFGETDLLIIVQNIGVVVVEIKSSFANQHKGVRQARRMKDFVNIVSSSLAEDICLPVVKCVIVCETNPNREDSWTIKQISDPKDNTFVWVTNNDALADVAVFRKCWTQVLTDLKLAYQSVEKKVSVSQFKAFVHIMTGLWSMVSFTGKVNCQGKWNSRSAPFIE